MKRRVGGPTKLSALSWGAWLAGVAGQLSRRFVLSRRKWGLTDGFEAAGTFLRPFEAIYAVQTRSACPFLAIMVHAEHSEPLEVGRGTEQGEVMADALPASHSCPSAAMSVTHHVAKLALHFGSRRPVLHFPGRVFLP